MIRPMIDTNFPSTKIFKGESLHFTVHLMELEAFPRIFFISLTKCKTPLAGVKPQFATIRGAAASCKSILTSLGLKILLIR